MKINTSTSSRHKNTALESAVAEMFAKLPWVKRVEQNLNLRDRFVIDIYVETDSGQWFVDVQEGISSIDDVMAILSSLKHGAFIDRAPKCSFAILTMSEVSNEIRERVTDAEIIDINVLRDLAARHPEAVKPVEPFLAAATKSSDIGREVSPRPIRGSTQSVAGVLSGPSMAPSEIFPQDTDSSQVPEDSDELPEMAVTVATVQEQASVNINATVIQPPVGTIVVSRQMLILQIETLLFALIGNVEAAENRRNDAPAFDLGLHEDDDFLAEIKRLTQTLDDVKAILETKSDLPAANTGKLKKYTDAFLEGLVKKCGERTGDAMFLGTVLGIGWIVVHVEQSMGFPITETTKNFLGKLVSKGGE